MKRLKALMDNRWCLSAWLGHAVRQGGLAAAVLDGTPLGHRHGVGRPKLRRIDGFSSWSGLTMAELTAATLERGKITPAPATQPRRSGRLLHQPAAAYDD